MSVVSSEFGIGSLKRWISVGLGLLDAINQTDVSRLSFENAMRSLVNLVPVSVSLLGLIVLRRVL